MRVLLDENLPHDLAAELVGHALERSQHARLQYLNFRSFENAFLQYQRGYYPQAEWERYRAIIQRVLADDSITRTDVDRVRGWGFTPEFER